MLLELIPLLVLLAWMLCNTRHQFLVEQWSGSIVPFQRSDWGWFSDLRWLGQACQTVLPQFPQGNGGMLLACVLPPPESIIMPPLQPISVGDPPDGDGLCVRCTS